MVSSFKSVRYSLGRTAHLLALAADEAHEEFVDKAVESLVAGCTNHLQRWLSLLRSAGGFRNENLLPPRKEFYLAVLHFFPKHPFELPSLYAREKTHVQNNEILP